MIRRLARRLIHGFRPSSRPEGGVESHVSYLDYLRSRGCRIGSNVLIIGNAKIDENHCWHIAIGDDVTIAPGAYILAHDASTKPLTGYTWVAPVTIEDSVFIGAHAVVLPGVTIGAGAIVAAGAVVARNIPARTIVAGVPARKIGTVDQHQARHLSQLKTYPRFDSSFTIARGVSLEVRRIMAKRIAEAGGGYVE